MKWKRFIAGVMILSGAWLVIQFDGLFDGAHPGLIIGVGVCLMIYGNDLARGRR